MRILEASQGDAQTLAELRALAMRESLEAIGRFDPTRVRERFLQKFDPNATRRVLVDDELAAFFVVLDKGDHLYVDHLYVHPDYQSTGIGSSLLELIKEQARLADKPIRLRALKGSRSNEFYTSHGFIKTHVEALDNYYQFTHR
jgi:GNAT superfamily N-acetyltransferase